MTSTLPDTLDGFAEAARRALPAADWDYLMAGMEEGGGRNVAAWRGLRLRPRVLTGAVSADTSATVLGRPLAAPILIAPNGRATRYHPDGEAALLAAAGERGAGVLLASSVSDSLDVLRGRAPATVMWSQIYMLADHARLRAHIARAQTAACDALVLTVDLTPDPRHPSVSPAPRAVWETTSGAPAAAVVPATLDDLAWLCEETQLPVVVKGVLRPDDALACIAAGARALVVSNHGGNQLPDVVATAEVLPEIAAACGASAEVYVDGGIRDGAAILKALALGARAVLVGRPFSHGLAAAGALGAGACLDILRTELERSMRLCGVATLAELDPNLIAP